MNNRDRARSYQRLSWGVLLVVLSGCIWLREDPSKLDLGVDPVMGALANSAAYRDTVGSLTYYEGLRPMRVRGYGLVVGLGKNGSKNCPRRIYRRLVESIYKQHRFSSNAVGVKNITPERLVNDLDTAVVVVEGDIPPAWLAGDKFEVVVTAVPGTETKSLRGGRLYTADLHVFRSISDTVAITGKVLARAAGPLFVNPFSHANAATASNPLQAMVLGGGRVIVDRRVRLVLLEPSYQRAQQMQDRINAHFPAAARVADAVSPSFIKLAIPEEYRGDTAHFLALVRALFLSHDPRFEAVRAQMLGKEMLSPDAPHALIAQAFEGLGRVSLPMLDDLYQHANDDVSFHAAAAGLRLGDHVAGDIMAAHARDKNCRHRFRATRALSEALGMAGAGQTLRQLLYDDDPRIQIAAYEALLKRQDSIIRSTTVGGDNFTLDLVPVEGPSFIYAKRTGQRRIALFGDQLHCNTPVFYRALDGSVTITAYEGDENLTVLRTALASGANSGPISAPREVAALIRLLGEDADVTPDGEVLGVGVDYAGIVNALHQLCGDRSIDARFVLEQPGVGELFGPPQPSGRPESEL